MTEMEDAAAAFTQDPRFLRSKSNPIALYCVSWDSTKRKGKRDGNQWQSLVTAMKVYQVMQKQGRNPKGTIRYVAGFGPL